jgi:hypothetical protein
MAIAFTSCIRLSRLCSHAARSADSVTFQGAQRKKAGVSTGLSLSCGQENYFFADWL